MSDTSAHEDSGGVCKNLNIAPVDYNGLYLGIMRYIVYWGYREIVEKKMETRL